MEKISGIVPQSKRVTAVDLRNAPPVRPGTPTFGRPVGISTALDLSKPTTAEVAVAKHQELIDRRKQVAQGPELIEDMTNRFFMHKKTSAPEVEPTLGAVEPVEVAPLDLSAIEAESQESRELTPPGTYLDVVA
ncbi:MAG: hypothetical protein KDD22_03335 [Bdellovibrionales bacterium]|nr:hypothetical protein [Bdellovibrionales bacterium]